MRIILNRIGNGASWISLINLRGFSAGDDYFMDGLRDTGLYDRDVFDYESVEVYKGPASTLFGRGSTGGTNSELRATADLNYPLADHTRRIRSRRFLKPRPPSIRHPRRAPTRKALM